MASNTEKTACNYLCKALKMYENGETMQGCEELQYALSILEVTIPEILSEKYSFWKDEYLDALFEEKSLRREEDEFEFFGMCRLMSDQTLTPLYVWVKMNQAREAFESVQIKLGEKSGKEMLKIPHAADEWSDYLDERTPEEIDWFYEVRV